MLVVTIRECVECRGGCLEGTVVLESIAAFNTS